MRVKTLKSSVVGRFATVGVINTVIDVGILFVLKFFGIPVVVANIISTSVAFTFSFFANKNYTFNAKNTDTKREFLLFIIVTLYGLWVLQSAVLYFTAPLFAAILPNGSISLLAAKIAATVVSLVWNYVFYNRVVFANTKSSSEQ
jgi:putative flippase GtrA